VLGGVLFSLQGVVVKLLAERYDTIQISFARFAFGLISLLPFVLASRGREPARALVTTGRLRLHMTRSFMSVISIWCGFYAIAYLPLATATAITFTRPLFLVLLALLFLGEIVRWRRGAATAIGFLGVLIVLRPDGLSADPAMLVALLGAALSADIIILIKKLSHTERNVTILFYFSVFTTLYAAIPVAFVWRTPDAYDLGLLALVGVLALAGQALNLRGYRAGETTAVTPFDYTRLLSAILLGWWFFLEVPDGWTLLGAAIVIVSTLYIARREAKLARAARRS